MNNPRHPWYFNIVIDDGWNVTLSSQDVWIMVATSVAQALGWITSEKKRRINALGLKRNPLVDTQLWIRVVGFTTPQVYYLCGYLCHTFDSFVLSLQNTEWFKCKLT